MEGKKGKKNKNYTHLAFWATNKYFFDVAKWARAWSDKLLVRFRGRSFFYSCERKKQRVPHTSIHVAVFVLVQLNRTE